MYLEVLNINKKNKPRSSLDSPTVVTTQLDSPITSLDVTAVTQRETEGRHLGFHTVVSSDLVAQYYR